MIAPQESGEDQETLGEDESLEEMAAEEPGAADLPADLDDSQV